VGADLWGKFGAASIVGQLLAAVADYDTSSCRCWRVAANYIAIRTSQGLVVARDNAALRQASAAPTSAPSTAR
jgi:hypothetical protein